MKRRYVVAVLLVLMGSVMTGYGWQRYVDAPLSVAAEVQTLTVAAPAATPLAWPGYGQAAVATREDGVVATHGSSQPQPTASTAKLITVLAIMRQKPFTDGKGEVITFSQADAALYQAYVAGNGSVTPVTAGLQWTQYQALQAVLLESANNVSDSLAIWAFGSMAAYRDYAQAMVQSLGMKDTTIGSDASGYSATTTSTAHDLALLATTLLDQPMLRDITKQSQAILPGAGLIENTNRLLVDGEILGLKTGWIPEAGGVFVLAGQQTIGEHTHEVITVVMGAPGGASRVAQDAAYDLYQSAKKNFSYQTVIAKGQQVGTYKPAWSAEAIPVIASDTISMVVWSGASPVVRLSADDLMPGQQGTVGAAEVRVNARSVTVLLTVDHPISEPSWWWRVVERGSF